MDSRDQLDAAPLSAKWAGGSARLAITALVRDALVVGIGGTLPTDSDYRAERGLSAGTIQRALVTLRNDGVMQVRSRGHKGRTVTDIDIGAAWQAGGLPPIRLLFPPSGPSELDRLASATTEALTSLAVLNTVHYSAGSRERLDVLREGTHDVTLVSSGALMETTSSEFVALRLLDSGSYYAPGSLVVVMRRHFDGPERVAIDPRSPDHYAFTNAEFPASEGFVHVECAFPDVPAAVLRGDVDAGIWHQSRSVIPLDLAGLSELQPRRDQTIRTWTQRSSAAFVALASDRLAAAVFRDLRLET